MAAIKALQQWCRLQCDGYRDVAVTNMTTSFRDGLAFCALIHKYRPDLIDYDSLSKGDVFNNNNLAFRVAEEQLGIPALLDAEDMVALRIPDRLSILTYVSQYYNYFHGRSPIGGVGGVKRPAEGSKEEPSEKKNLPVVAKTFVSEKAIENHPPPTITVKTSPKLSRAAEQKTVLTESSNKTGTLNSKCVMCTSHVHLVQRHFVDGKLYHRSCFKCSECSNLLLAGAYKAGKEPGSFICNTHQSNQNGCKPPSSGVEIRPASAVVGPKSDSRTQSVTSHSSVLSTPVTVVLKPVDSTPVPQPWTTSAQKTQAARQRFFQSAPPAPEGPASSRKFSASSDISGQKKVPLSPEEEKNRARAVISKKLAEENCNNNNTRQFVIRSSERRFGDAPSSADIPSWRRAKCGLGTAGKQAAQPSTTPTSNKESPWLKAINKESTRPTTVSSNTKEPDRTEAPVDWRSNLKPVKKGPGLKTPASAENRSIILEEPKPDVSSKSSPITISSPPPWTPQSPISPPPSGPTSCRAPSPQEPHQDSAGTKNRNHSTAIIYPSPSSIGSPPLVPVWHRPLSPKPCHRSEGWGSENGSCLPSSSQWPVVDSISFPPAGPASHKSPSPQQPRQSSKGSKNGKYLSPTNASRSEMRSPVSKSYHIPMDQIVKELHEIEDSLSNLERKGVEMEKKLRSCEEEGEGDILMDPLMVDWFNLIRKKQMYIRRESELVYIAKTLDLEEQQPGVEGELRRLLEKPDHLKSTEERRREGKLMDKLVEIVNGRNAIVEGLDEDRLREEEEDQQLDEMMQNLGIKKSKNKRKTSFSKLFRRKSKKLAVE